MKIKVSIDGKEPFEVDAVRVFVEGIDIDEPVAQANGERDGLKKTQVQFNFTDEGLIYDLVDDDEINSGTASKTYEEIATDLYLYG